MPEIFDFDSVLNVRDFGGHEGDDGYVISGKLYRGAQISNMSSGDIARFTKFGLDAVIDLRYGAERERQSSNWGDDFRPHTFEFDDELSGHAKGGLAPHEAFIIHDLKHADEARDYMMQSYKQRPSDPAFVDILSKSLSQMAHTGTTIYVHCAAGKDRTGTFAAYILSLLGVSPDIIMDEYLLTRKAADIGPIMNMVAGQLKARYGRDFDPEALRPIFGVDEAYLTRSLESIGDPQAYWHDVLGLSGEELLKFRAQYLGPKPD